MSICEIRFPAWTDAKVIYNHLSSDDTDNRFADLFLARMPSGLEIDVGWYPEDSETGAYLVKIINDDHEVQTSYRLGKVEDVIERLSREVMRIAKHNYNTPVALIDATSE